MATIEELIALVDQLTGRLRTLEDQMQLIQLTAEYGPSVDNGAAEDVAALWTDDGVFEAVGAIRMVGHDEIVGMVNGEGHQGLIGNGCGHVLTTPHVEVRGDEAFGRSHALNIRWDAEQQRFWVARVSANSWRWVRTSEGWRVAERINANLDGSAASRALFTSRDHHTPGYSAGPEAST